MKTEVITRRVKPGAVDKLQAEVAALEADGAKKQKMIDTLQADLGEQNVRLEAVEAIITS
jgi:hypothetical protein